MVCLHYAPKSVKAASPALENFINTGYTAVSFFFVLSGFVLTYSYMDSAGSITVSRRSFWVARLARIYPAYALALLLMFPRFLGDMMEGAGTLARVIGRVTVSLRSCRVAASVVAEDRSAMELSGLQATLSVEAFFYSSFPFLAIWLVSRFRTTRALLTAIVLLWLISQVAPILYLARDLSISGHPSPRLERDVFQQLRRFLDAPAALQPAFHFRLNSS